MAKILMPLSLECDFSVISTDSKMNKVINKFMYGHIIPTQCFYRFFRDFDWSVGKIKLFLHFDKSPCVGIFDNCLDITVVDCVDNNELYIKLL